MKNRVSVYGLFAALFLIGCVDQPFGFDEEALAPAGSNAVLVSHTVPSTFAPGERRTVTVTMRNTGLTPGANDWTANQYMLYTQDYQWGWVYTYNTSTVAVGNTYVYSFTIRAPSTAGNYSFTARMFNDHGGFFGDTVSIPVTVSSASTASYACAYVAGSSSVPTTMAPGETRSVSVAVRNSGSANWPSTGFYLYSRNNPLGQWGTINVPTSGAVNAGQTTLFNFSVQAPSTAGTYPFVWDMFDSSAGFFGSNCVNLSIVVDAASTPSYNATEVSHSFPTLMTAGRTQFISVTMTNSGSSSWTGSSFALVSTTTPQNLWTTTSSALGSGETVASGASRAFSILVAAPTTAGTYPMSWRMLNSGGVGWFGATVSGSVQVTLCGNGTINAGEQCDDGNLVAGDGCGTTCQVETRSVDLASGASGRSFLGSSGNAQATPVTTGDVTGDGVLDVMVSQINPPSGTVVRSTAGVVEGFIGGAGFFTGATDTLPSSAGFQVVGAEAGDQLAAIQNGSIVVGDVTRDGVADLVVSSARADGVMNARTDCGEVYVISGGLSLSSAGLIDLGATTPPTALAATFIGANAGDALRALLVADLTGDGINDLVLGAPQSGTGGSTAGVIYIVVGTSTAFSGTIDLASPGGITVYQITGAATGDQLGLFAASGDFMGDGNRDLLIGSRSHTHLNPRDGGAWAFAGPITSSRTITGTVGSAPGPSAAFYGAHQADNLGTTAVADVRGTTRADVLIGVPQYWRAPSTQSGAVVVWDGPIAPGTYDLSTGSAGASAVIVGADQYDNLGNTVTAVDVDGNGRLDVVAGAPLGDGPGNTRTNAGEVVVVLGGTLSGTVDLSVSPPNMVVYSATASDQFAIYNNALTAGDIDGDGRGDFCAGTQFGGGATHPGRVDCVRSPY